MVRHPCFTARPSLAATRISLADATNLARLRKALADLQAKPNAVPPFALIFLRRGHAIHFRCQHPEAMRIRVDLMSKMRGVDPFAKLWKRRTTLEIPGGEQCDLLSLPDLMQAKKTQCDKDWPMIRRLIEAHYFENQADPNRAQSYLGGPAGPPYHEVVGQSCRFTHSSHSPPRTNPSLLLGQLAH